MISSDCISTISNSFCHKDGSECFLKGCKWSPDGFCILTASGDDKIRLFEVGADSCPKSEEPIITYNEGGTVYDYSWYPSMSSSDPISCVFASCSKDAPVHLWDAFTGELRATYQPINQFDEVHAAYSLSFSFDGKIYCGFKKQIKIFDLGIPGRISEVRCVKEHQGNIISTIAVNPAMPSVYALGCYNKTVGIYTEPNGELLCLMEAHTGGVTQVSFSPSGHYLYSGARMDKKLFCWDLRMPGTILFTISREVNTSQRIQFDLMSDGQFLLTDISRFGLQISVHNPDVQTRWRDRGIWCVKGPHTPDVQLNGIVSGRDREIWCLKSGVLEFKNGGIPTDQGSRESAIIRRPNLLMSGSTDGTVSVFSTSQAPQESGLLDRMYSWQAHQDCANGVSSHPQEKFLATASGQRHINLDLSDDESEVPDEIVENKLKIWKLSIS